MSEKPFLRAHAEALLEGLRELAAPAISRAEAEAQEAPRKRNWDCTVSMVVAVDLGIIAAMKKSEAEEIALERFRDMVRISGNGYSEEVSVDVIDVDALRVDE